MADPDLSAAVLDALRAELPADDIFLIERVEVSLGWGDIQFVHVYSGISRDDAGEKLEESIHKIAHRVMAGRRHAVRIIWT